MEIMKTLQKPYTEEQKNAFIVQNNHIQGYKINETDKELQAIGYTVEEIKQLEKEMVSKLSLTKREVFLALYKDKRITPEQIKAQITNPEALIEFEYATEYYRAIL